jgi:hypothetical protein
MIGTVYKIEIGENIYIGSTIKKLYKRQDDHTQRLKQNIRKNKLYEECRKHNINKIICIPLETKEIENELEIRKLEQEYIDKLEPTLNHLSPPSGLTHKEYNKQDWIKNREHYLQIKKEYYDKNKEEIKTKSKERYEKNKEKILKKEKEKREKNKEIINKNLREKINCPICNSIINKSCLSRHKKTKKCLSMKQ